MHRCNVLDKIGRYLGWTALAAAAIAVFAAPSVRADFVISAQTVAAGAGSSGNALDVSLKNTGPSAVTIGAFNFELNILASSGVSFTDVTTATSLATYIFDGDSLLGPDIGTVVNSQDIQASDLPLSPGTTVGAGDTFGLGHVLFDVSSLAATGSFSVVIAPFSKTSLSDDGGNNVAFSSTNGEIDVTGSAPVVAPTPSAIVGGSVLFCFLGVLAIHRRMTIAAQAAA